MATSIPTFQFKVSEGMIDVDTSVDRLFGYCIQATQGPVMEPTFVASNTEAQRIFGKEINFAPHFYQKPTGVVLCRVEFDNMAAPSLTYKAYPLDNNGAVDEDGTQFDIMTIEGIYKGTAKYTVNIQPSFKDGYNLTVKIDGVTSKTYQNLSDLVTVAKRINTKFSNYLKATIPDNMFETDENGKKVLKAFKPAQLIKKTSPADMLSGGSNGFVKKTNGDVSDIAIDDKGQVPSSAFKSNYGPTDVNGDLTLQVAYQAAFNKMKEVDLLGIATLSDKRIVRNELINHIVEVTDPEVAQLRFGITGYLDYETKKNNGDTVSISDLVNEASEINNEYIIYIGQGVMFKEETVEKAKPLYPYQCVQLYTGIRSALGYSEAIFGGESKKVLTGVKDTLPVITTTPNILKEYVEELNEGGVCTFKKEYGEVTFVEGVTTYQDADVLSYESIMSIVLYVSKRLIRVAKPYQGQNLNEDLKSSLQTALSNELKSIVETDGTLIALEDYNIPPYDVSVKSAAVTTFNEAGDLVRESKIIIQCKIVPIGALRDIDLGVIVI